MIDFDFSLTGLVVYDTRMYNVGHNVRRWADTQERAFTRNAKLKAPVNKRPNKSLWYKNYPVGALKESISGSVTRVGPRHLQTDISVDVPYAIWVIRGTLDKAPITNAEDSGFDYMFLPWNPGFHKREHFTVSGQRPNNFLAEAARATARTHSSLRGFDRALFQQW